MLRKLLDLFYVDIAIDLGTSTTIICEKGKGIVLVEPSIVAVREVGGVSHPVAVGIEAKLMQDRAPQNYKTIRPLKEGVIADFETAEVMLKYFIKKVYKTSFFRSSVVVICVPSGATPVEKRAIQDVAHNAGASKVFLIDEPIAAAIGANLPISDPKGFMVVDIGGGTTEIAIISLGGMAYSKSIRVAGDKLDDAIINYIRRKFNLVIGYISAQHIKETFSTAYIDENDPQSGSRSMNIRGINIVDNLPAQITITARNTEEAMKECIDDIIDGCKEGLANVPPELTADVIEKGIVLTGGGALLQKIDVAISKALGIPVIIANNPLECVAIGSLIALENLKELKHTLKYY